MKRIPLVWVKNPLAIIIEASLSHLPAINCYTHFAISLVQHAIVSMKFILQNAFEGQRCNASKVQWKVHSWSHFIASKLLFIIIYLYHIFVKGISHHLQRFHLHFEIHHSKAIYNHVVCWNWYWCLEIPFRHSWRLKIKSSNIVSSGEGFNQHRGEKSTIENRFTFR